MTMRMCLSMVERGGIRCGLDRLLKAQQDWCASKCKAKRALVQAAELSQAIQVLRDAVGRGEEHPKVTALKQVLLQHFGAQEGAGGCSRAMVFVETRASVQEVYLALRQCGSSLLNVERFVGQGGAKQACDKGGQTQTEQADVMCKFRSGL